MNAANFKRWLEEQPGRIMIEREKARKQLTSGIYPADEWMLVMLVICRRPTKLVARSYLLEKLELAQVKGHKILDRRSRAEYKRLGGT